MKRLLLAATLLVGYVSAGEIIGGYVDSSPRTSRSAPATRATAEQVWFGLQLFYERADDESLARREADKLQVLVARLAPHILLDIQVLKAVSVRARPVANGQRVPMHAPTSPAYTALLLTRTPIGAQGWAGPPQGVVSITELENKVRKGGDSADITIHEWLHTITGQPIGNRRLPDPHTNAQNGFAEPTRYGRDGEANWDDWYRWLLR